MGMLSLNLTELPSVPFPLSLAVHHQSLAFRARHAKNEAPEEEAGSGHFQNGRQRNDGNEHEQKKTPLTSIPLFSRPHSLLFSQSTKRGGSFYFYASTH